MGEKCEKCNTTDGTHLCRCRAGAARGFVDMEWQPVYQVRILHPWPLLDIFLEREGKLEDPNRRSGFGRQNEGPTVNTNQQRPNGSPNPSPIAYSPSMQAQVSGARTRVQPLIQTSRGLTAPRTLRPSRSGLPRKETKKAEQKAAKFERRSWSKESCLEEGIAGMNGYGLWASKARLLSDISGLNKD